MARPTDAQKERVRLGIEKWKKVLKLENYKVDIHYHRGKDKETPDAYAYVLFGAGFSVFLHIYNLFWNLSELEQDKVLLHECLHVVSHGATESEIDHLTESIWCLTNGAE